MEMFTLEVNITIKGISQNISFDISIQNKNGKAKLTFDRTKHNVSIDLVHFFKI